jgi:hypothetical protein
MYLVQILLPLSDNDGRPFAKEIFERLQQELSARFGGLTAYSRAPAKGLWAAGPGRREDDIVIVEVMTEKLERDWWEQFRCRVERLLRQEELIIRANPTELL